MENTPIRRISAAAAFEWGTVILVVSACALLIVQLGRGWLWSF
jgi:hypothetical protein